MISGKCDLQDYTGDRHTRRQDVALLKQWKLTVKLLDTLKSSYRLNSLVSEGFKSFISCANGRAISNNWSTWRTLGLLLGFLNAFKRVTPASAFEVYKGRLSNGGGLHDLWFKRIRQRQSDFNGRHSWTWCNIWSYDDMPRVNLHATHGGDDAKMTTNEQSWRWWCWQWGWFAKIESSLGRSNKPNTKAEVRSLFNTRYRDSSKLRNSYFINRTKKTQCCNTRRVSYLRWECFGENSVLRRNKAVLKVFHRWFKFVFRES